MPKRNDVACSSKRFCCASEREAFAAVLTVLPCVAGIKKPTIERYRSKKGVDPKMLKNARFARKGDAKAKTKA